MVGWHFHGTIPKSRDVFSGDLRCVEFLTNPLISCRGGEIDLLTGILEIELCLDQIKIHFFLSLP